MMLAAQTLYGTTRELPLGAEQALSSYRHSIFIEKLGWQLPCTDKQERDEFDRPDTIYVIAHDADGDICGCGRLLPTTKPYLLGEVFPQLMGGAPVPHSPDVWELSRFSATPLQQATWQAADLWANTCGLVAAAVESAAKHGAKRLITVSPIGIERLLRRMGVHSHRVAPPCLVDGKPVVAIWIEIDEITTSALGVSIEQEANRCH